MARIERPKAAFYAAWIGLSGAALLLGWVLAFVCLVLVEALVGPTLQIAGQTRFTEDYFFSYALFPMVGLATGGLQVLLLRRVLPPRGLDGWIAATVIGFCVPMVVNPLLPASFTGPVAPRIAAAAVLGMIGAGAGIAQAVVLRRRVSHAGWWIPITLAGWAIAGLAGGRSFSTLWDALPVALIPPAFGCLGLWLLLDRLGGESGQAPILTPRDPVRGASA